MQLTKIYTGASMSLAGHSNQNQQHQVGKSNTLQQSQFQAAAQFGQPAGGAGSQ